MKHLSMAIGLLVALLANAPAASAQTDYVIGANDVLAISVFGEPELSNNSRSKKTAPSTIR